MVRSVLRSVSICEAPVRLKPRVSWNISMRFVTGCLTVAFGLSVAAFGAWQFWMGLTAPASVLPRPSAVPHAAESLRLMNEYLDRSKEMDARDAPIGERRQVLSELRAAQESLQRREKEAESTPATKRWMIVAVGVLGMVVGGCFVLDGVRRVRLRAKTDGTPCSILSGEKQSADHQS